MAFRFKRKETIADGFQRIAREQIAAAVSALEKRSTDGIHDARRAIKKLRSLLRLFRKTLPPDACQHTNEALRNVARSLSEIRDAQVRPAVFARIAKDLEAGGTAPLQRQFTTAADSADALVKSGKIVEPAIRSLRTIGNEFPPLHPDTGWTALARGFKTSYRRARKTHAIACEEQTTRAIHTWRRRCKDLEYHLQLLKKSAPSEARATLRATRQLNDLLGDDHDLATLGTTLSHVTPLTAELRDSLQERIDRRRRKLQRRAFQLGNKLLFEKPSTVAEELAAGWKRWRPARD